MCRSVLQYVAIARSQQTAWLRRAMQPLHYTRVALCCSVFRIFAACCSVLQCDAVSGSVLQCLAFLLHLRAFNKQRDLAAMQPSMCCSMLQCVAVCYSVVQRFAPVRSQQTTRARRDAASAQSRYGAHFRPYIAVHHTRTCVALHICSCRSTCTHFTCVPVYPHTHWLSYIRTMEHAFAFTQRFIIHVALNVCSCRPTYTYFTCVPVCPHTYILSYIRNMKHITKKVHRPRFQTSLHFDTRNI